MNSLKMLKMIFTYCSAKKIVLTNDSGSLGWIVFMLLSIFFILYLMGASIYNDWKSDEADRKSVV